MKSSSLLRLTKIRLQCHVCCNQNWSSSIRWGQITPCNRFTSNIGKHTQWNYNKITLQSNTGLLTLPANKANMVLITMKGTTANSTCAHSRFGFLCLELVNVSFYCGGSLPQNFHSLPMSSPGWPLAKTCGTFSYQASLSLSYLDKWRYHQKSVRNKNQGQH